MGDAVRVTRKGLLKETHAPVTGVPFMKAILGQSNGMGSSAPTANTLKNGIK